MAAGTLLSWEVHSFVTKFLNLTTLGHNASLLFDFSGGQLEVNLQSKISEVSNSLTAYNQKSSSARARRRKRRGEARKSQQFFKQNVTNDVSHFNTNLTETIQSDVNDIATLYQEEDNRSSPQVSDAHLNCELKGAISSKYK